MKVMPKNYSLRRDAPQQPQPAIARIENMLANWKHYDLRQVELTLRDIVQQADWMPLPEPPINTGKPPSCAKCPVRRKNCRRKRNSRYCHALLWRHFGCARIVGSQEKEKEVWHSNIGKPPSLCDSCLFELECGLHENVDAIRCTDYRPDEKGDKV